MNKIRLYIEDQEIELQEDLQVAITKQFEELSNPTVICNDYTKTVKIPMTAKNNIIFGNIYNPDMITPAMPENLLLNMSNYEGFWESSDLMHTNKWHPVYYDHPQILFPQSLYLPYFPTGLPDDYHLISYRVYRGVNNWNGPEIYETYIDNTTEVGRHSFTFTLTSSMTEHGERQISFEFIGSTTSQTHFWDHVTIDGIELEDGTYQMSFDTEIFDTTNNQAVIKNMVLTKGDTVVYGNDIANHIGIYFDPFRKLNFRLEWNADLLMQGYAKMLSTTKENGKGYYELTLNGELGKALQEMQKITFDPSLSGESDGKYYIDGSQYIDMEMNKELIYSGWTHNQTIADIHNPNKHFYDIINFAPNNAFNEDFDYKSYEYYNSTYGKQMQRTFAETLESGNFKNAVGVDAETVIGDGLTPRGIGEYRSYLQQPFIYFNKLFQIFQDKSEQLTGYKFDLDSSWFAISNPLWYRSAILLNNLSDTKLITYLNKYGYSTTTSFITHPDSSQRYKYRFSGVSDYLTFSATSEQLPMLQSDNKTFKIENITNFGGMLKFNFKMQVATSFSSMTTIKLRNNFVFLINFFAYDGHTETQIGRICVTDSGSTYSPTTDPSYETITVKTGSYTAPSGSGTISLVNRNITFQLAPIVTKNDMKFYYKLTGYHPQGALSAGSPFIDSNNREVELGNITTTYQTTELDLNVMPLVGKSFSRFTLNDLWNNDYRLYDIIMNYCKMYRIFVKVDDFNKKIIFKPSHKYFENYEILNWTDKVCTDKTFKVKPVSWEHKYISFNYKESGTELGKRYKETYGAEYGEKRITTDYNFNAETNKLFSDIIPSLTYTPNVLSWNNLTDQNVVYSLPAEVYVHMSNEDNKFVSQFGSFYLMRGLSSFDNSVNLNLRSVVISDDSVLQQRTNTYYYSQSTRTLSVTTYPRLDLIYSNNMCVFGKPMANYTYSATVYNNGVDIYNKVWKKYLTERYNRNNKVVTCYIYMSPSEYIAFDFNKFVKIEDQLYIVNKIYDYDAVTNQKVKVDLITVQDITGYTTR